MAAKLVNNLLPETGRELCRVRGEEGECLGYRQDILTEVLSDRDKALLVCPRCQGILKEASTSSNGEQLCSCCTRGEELIHPNISIWSMVLSLECSCPLSKRGCEWVGTLGESENHVEVCNFVLEKCSLGCGKVLRRDQMSLHESDKCINRNMEVECELGCGMTVHRDDMTQHISLECGEKEIECPFVKYKCEVGMIKRRELDTHLAEKRSEHFELKVNAMEEIFIGQNKEIEMLKNEMDKMKMIEKCLINVDKKVIEQNTSLIETLLNRPDFSKLEWNIKNLPKEMRVPVEAHFEIDGYYFKLECIWGNRNALLLNFCPQNGWNYDKLKWPFRAEFIIRCELDASWYSARYKNEFKTDVIEVKKEQYRPCTEITIASIYESKFSFDTIRYVDKIRFEIYVIQ